MSNKPQLNTLSSITALDQALASKIAGCLSEAIAERGQATLAVSGGATPANMFTLLSQQDLDWSKVTVLLVDERWLPGDHPDSNEHLLQQTLLAGKAAQCHYLSLKTADETATDGQFVVEDLLEELPWPLDVVHLGMGSDGHTASWFRDAPQYPQLRNLGQQLCVAIQPSSAPYPRLSLTPSAVMNSRRIFIHITGKTKREVMDQALLKGTGYPVALVLHQAAVPVEIFWAG